MAAKKTKIAKKTTFYLYKWSNGYTTFLVADSPDDAIEKIKRGREVACPPEVKGERLSKKRLSSTSQDFILTVSSSRQDDEEFQEDTEESKKDLN
ncbi:MAG TPA: hypothetical protein VM577_08740 [Anaerovoracaceae bacterium]|nr:hypothetical protein [Anaerovoracaceae bacterium]